MGTIKTTNIETITGSGTLTLGQSGETITIPSGVTITNNAARYFHGYSGTTNQSFTSNANTKLTLISNAVQSHTSYDTSTQKFTATADDAGDWLFQGQISVFVSANDMYKFRLMVYKNGSLDFGTYFYEDGGTASGGRHRTGTIRSVITVAENDYFELYGFAVGTSPEFVGGDSSGGYRQCNFTGVKLD